jgi:hypothetical protein
MTRGRGAFAENLRKAYDAELQKDKNPLLDPQVAAQWRINYGCIGLLSVYLDPASAYGDRARRMYEMGARTPARWQQAAQDAVSPESLPGVKCFVDLESARVLPHRQDQELFIFVKQGKWKKGFNPPKNREIPKDSITGLGDNPNDYNYAIYFQGMKGQLDTWVWMNHCKDLEQQKGPQYVRVGRAKPPFGEAEMFCVVAVPKQQRP